MKKVFFFLFWAFHDECCIVGFEFACLLYGWEFHRTVKLGLQFCSLLLCKLMFLRFDCLVIAAFSGIVAVILD